MIVGRPRRSLSRSILSSGMARIEASMTLDGVTGVSGPTPGMDR